MNRRRFLFSVLMLSLAACSRSKKHAALPAGSRVLALGDSLTFGYGAERSQSYPSVLAQLTGWQVENGGVSGDTSEQALARLPALMRTQPKLVLVCIGGNDFLRGLPEQDTRRHIGKMIETVQAGGAEAVLAAVPHLTTGALLGFPSDHALYRDLAEQYAVPLLSDAWAEILGNKDLKSDAIHANAAGYRVFAEKMAAFLKKQGFQAA